MLLVVGIKGCLIFGEVSRSKLNYWYFSVLYSNAFYYWNLQTYLAELDEDTIDLPERIASSFGRYPFNKVELRVKNDAALSSIFFGSISIFLYLKY